MADFIFDGPNKLITEPAGAGDTTFDVERDIYSAWKRWIASGVGAPFVPAFQVEGGTPIGATGLFTGSTFILINGWKIRAASHDHQLFLTGNLYSDDGVVTVPVSGFSTSVNISASVAAQGISTGSGLSPAQEADLALIKAATAGRVVISSDGLTVTLYAEDGVTPLRVLDVSADLRTRTPQ